MCILAYFYKFKVPNTPSVENYDNPFLFFENLISKWTLATEILTPSRDPRGIYIPSNKGKENVSHYQSPCRTTAPFSVPYNYVISESQQQQTSSNTS